MLRSFVSSRLLIAGFFLGSLATPLLAQYSEEVINSPQGGSPFLIVYEDETGNSNREGPGLYIREDGFWKRVFRGNFHPAPRVGGASLHLAMGSVTDRYEIVTSYNDRFGIFSINSNENDSETYIEFGTGSGELRDPISNSLVKIPPVENIQDIQFYERMIRQDGQELQVVLISIKANSPFGDGMTFAAVLSPQAQSDSGLHLLYSPILLDWNFVDRKLLERRLHSDDEFQGLLSLNLVAKLSEAQSNDNAVLQNWRAEIQRLYRINEEDFETGEILWNAVPYFRLKDGKIAIKRLPSVEFGISKNKAISVFNPINNEGGVFVGVSAVSLEAWANSSPDVHKRILLDSSRRPAVVQVPASGSAQKSSFGLLQFEGGVFYLAHPLPDSGRLEFTAIRPSGEQQPGVQPQKVEWHIVQYKGKSVLIVSWDFGDNQFTDAYKIEIDRSQVYVSQQIRISDRFYSHSELEMRVHESGAKALFDNMTEPTRDKNQYERSRRETAPHTDLFESLRLDAPQFYFPKPLQTKPIGLRFMYREFEDLKDQESRTGIYPHPDRKQHNELAYRGKLVDHPLTDNDSWLLDNVMLPNNLKVSVAMLAPARKNGEQSSELVILVSPHSIENSPVASAITKDSFPFDAKSLINFGLLSLQNKDEKSKKTTFQLTAFASFEDLGTYIYEFSVEVSPSGDVDIRNRSMLTVSETDLSREEILARLLFDKSGKAYWIKHRGESISDPDLEVQRISDAKTIEPNSGQRIRLKTYHEHQKKEQKADSAKSDDIWRVVSSGQDSGQQKEQNALRYGVIYQTDVFPEYRRLLDSLADPDQPARHVFLEVSPELEEYALAYAKALRLRNDDRPQNWNLRNPRHSLSIVNAKFRQEQAIKSLRTMREERRRGKAPVLLADAGVLKSAGRPKPGEDAEQDGAGYYLEALKSNDAEIDIDGVSNENLERDRFPPSALYWLATEGRFISLDQFRPKDIQPTVSTLVIGTKQDWDQILQASGPEAELGLGDHFERIELGYPNVEFRKELLRQLFKQPELRALSYSPNLDVVRQTDEELSDEEAFDTLFTFLVNRAEQLAKEENRSPFEAFLAVLKILNEELLFNFDFRSQREFGRQQIEHVLSQVFSTPLNLKYLPEDDPLRIISQDNAAFLWKKAGCAAPLELRQRVLDVLKAQLSTDHVRNLPSSAIVIGGHGTGKTRMALTLIEFAGLRRYNMYLDPEQNKASNVFYLNMNEVENNEDALKHLLMFLSLPNGARGYVILDDFHKAPEAVRNQFLKLIREFQDNATVSLKLGDYLIEKPVRNLSVLLFLNPPDSKEKIARFAKDKDNPSDVELILAQLSDQKGELEKSTINRFGDIINFDGYGEASKSQALLDTLDGSSRTSFMNQQQLVLVGTDVVDRLSHRFPDANYRDYLSGASKSLLSLPSAEDHLYIVVPKRNPSMRPRAQKHGFNASGAEVSGNVKNYIEGHFEAVPVVSDHRGRIAFLRYVMESFRRRLFEQLLRTVSEDEAFASTSHIRHLTVLPLAQSVLRHLEEYPSVNLSELLLNAKYFGVTDVISQQQFMTELKREIEASGRVSPKYAERLPVGQVPIPKGRQDFGSFYTHHEPDTREHVLAETVRDLQGALEKQLARTLQLDGLKSFPAEKDWISQEFKREHDLQIQGVSEILRRYLVRIFEVHDEGLPKMDQYEAMRLFVMAVDKALYQLPWDRVIQFLISSLDLSTKDLSLGQSSFIQELVFGRNSNAPLRPFDKSWVTGLASSVRLVNESADREAEMAKRFQKRCQQLLKGVAQ